MKSCLHYNQNPHYNLQSSKLRVSQEILTQKSPHRARKKIKHDDDSRSNFKFRVVQHQDNKKSKATDLKEISQTHAYVCITYSEYFTDTHTYVSCP